MLDMDGNETWRAVNFISERFSKEEKKKLLFYIFRGYSLEDMEVEGDKIVVKFDKLGSEERIQYLMDGVY